MWCLKRICSDNINGKKMESYSSKFAVVFDLNSLIRKLAFENTNEDELIQLIITSCVE